MATVGLCDLSLDRSKPLGKHIDSGQREEGAPSIVRMSASWESGTTPPSFVGISSLRVAAIRQELLHRRRERL
jgi:hypothetical protein